MSTPSAGDLRYAGYLLLSDPAVFHEYGRRLPGLAEPPVLAMARAIAGSPGWPEGCAATLVAQPGDSPRLTVLGRFDATGEAWLRRQSQALLRSCTHLRYIDYLQAERDCARLGEHLQGLLGAELSRASFAAIPRGGMIVLGLLASLLHLDREQTGTSDHEEAVLVVVDDCALSGARFSRFLDGCGSSRVVFAPVYSHPELRSAIQAGEPRVEHVVSAGDLTGRMLSQDPFASGAYWSGDIEPLAFPWSEPDRLVWDPDKERWEVAWRIVPPELCLKNRPRPGAEPIPVQVHPAS